MILQKNLTPEDVLNIIIRYIHKQLPEHMKDSNITASFVDHKGSIEVVLADPKSLC